MLDTFPEIRTERLLLRKIRNEDLASLVKYADNRKVSDNILNIPYPFREPDAAMRMGYVSQGFRNGTRYVFAIILQEREELIGEISLHLLDKRNPHAQLSYWIGEPFWNRGFATEATAGILHFGFDSLPLELIYADCQDVNIPSQRVLVKNRMSEHSRNGNLIVYRIVRGEYKTENAGSATLY